MSLNHSLSENNPQNFFVTFFVGVLDLKSGLLTYCNAGHNPPILFHESRIEFMDVKVNLAAGIINSAEYEESSIQLNGGDKILMFTDVVTEAKNKSGEFYSESRLLELAQNNSFCDSKGLVERIVDDVSAFSVGMEQNDDLTLFSFTYKSRDDNKS
jgi:sigma-B regulation protein RsbU (phosphoserine phosphatase)